jgi:hypothetical protein
MDDDDDDSDIDDDSHLCHVESVGVMVIDRGGATRKVSHVQLLILVLTVCLRKKQTRV